ncbi:MAG: alanine dehydrogenase [Clostridia bacterium]
MIIGIPKEIKENEDRVSITPDGVLELVNLGHAVHIEKSAGLGSSIEDKDYVEAGAKIMSKEEVFETADIIVKVKEPLEEEYTYFKDGQTLFTYLHLAADKKQAEFLLKKNITGIAYETVEDEDGMLPLLNPMSEVAGRMAIQIGANLLQKNNGGRGMLLGGVPGVLPSKVCIIGAGNVGQNAAKIAIGMGAQVTILDISSKKLKSMDDRYSSRVTTLISSAYNIANAVKEADLLIGAVLIPGGKAPKLVTKDMVKAMKKGAVIVDVAIDQGGCIATIDRVTTHKDPFYEKYGVIHYSVANMPGAVPRTSTFALVSATIPYLKKILSKPNIEDILKTNEDILKGLNTYKGKCTNANVAKALDLEYTNILEII